MPTQRIAVTSIALQAASDPRLRFDKVAAGLVSALQASLSGSVPQGKVVLLTITAPLRQDSKTAVALQSALRALLKAGRTRLRTTILGNRIEVRVLKGPAAQTPKLLGFVHNRKPDAAVIFEVARCLLASLDCGESAVERWLIIGRPGQSAPLEAIRSVCLALRAHRVFKRILVADRAGLKVL